MDDFSYHTGPSPESDSAGWKPISEFDLKHLSASDDSSEKDFWLGINLPARGFKEPSLYISAFLEGFEVWLAGVRLYDYNKDIDNEFRYYKSHIISLPGITKDRFLMIKICYSNCINIGDIYAVAVGSREDIAGILVDEQESNLKSGIKELLLGFLLIVLGFVSIFVFLIRIKNRDYPFASFGFFAFCVGMKYVTALKFLHLMNLSPLSSHYLENLFFLLVPVGLFAFAAHIFGPEKGKNIRRLWQAHLVFTGIVLILIRLNRMYDPLVIIFFLGTSLTCLYFLFSDGKEKDPKVRIPFIVFFLLLIILLINELLKSFHFSFLPIDLFGWGLLALVFALGYVLIEQYTKTYIRMQKITLDLEKKRYELLKLEQVNLLTQFEALKNQLNPHFMFNNFSTLVSIIEEDPALAVDYVQELTKVYRYILKTRVKDLVKIKDEISFVRSYEFLLSKRFESNLILSIRIPESHMDDMIPPFSLQLLIENAVNHNIISSKKVLSVEINIDGECLVVVNNRQPKNGETDSTGIGLSNLTKRYRFFTNRNVEIFSDHSHFTVKLPLLMHKG